MRNLIDYVNEAVDQSQISPEGEKIAKEFGKELCNELNKVKLEVTNKKYKQSTYTNRAPGEFYCDNIFNLCNVKYNGVYYVITNGDIYNIYETGWAVNRDIVAIALKDIFNLETDLLESILDTDEDILRRSKEAKQIFDYYKHVYDTIKKTFKLNKVELSSDQYNRPDKRTLGNKSLPTIDYKGIHIQLAYLYVDSYRANIRICIIAYEDKSSETLDAEKAARQAERDKIKNMVCKDCVGRELKVGDFITYSVRSISDGNEPLPTGTITSVSAQKVKVGDRLVYGFRCCLISRANGERIE